MRSRTWYATGSLILAASVLAAPASASQVPVSRAWPRVLQARAAWARLALATGGLTGLVKGITGSPYPGVCVMATGPLGGGAVVHRAVSHSDGRYLLTHLRPGRYPLRIGSCAGAPLSVAWPGTRGVVTVLPGRFRTLSPAIAWPTRLGLRTGQSPAARRGKAGSISGRVTGSGRPLAHICAVAIPASLYPLKPPEPRATTSKTGRYRISGLRPGRYLVVFRTGLRWCPDRANWLPQWYPYLNSPFPPDKAASVRVRAGRDAARIDGRLKLGGEITGVVRSRAGRPIRGICVSDFSFSPSFSFYEVSVASATGKGGRYALHGLFRGSYQIEFEMGCGNKGDYAPQWWRHQSSLFSANAVKVTGRRTVSGIDAALLPGAAVTGTVRAITARGKPLAGICVSASQDLGEGATAVTARNGTYRLDGLFGGRIQVSFDPTCGGVVSAGYLQAQRTVTVRAGHTRMGVNAYLRLGAGIAGVITGPHGQRADPCVTVGDQGDDIAFPGLNGRYLIEGVPPGKYTVFFDSGCDSKGSLAPQWYNNKPDEGSANLVTFTAGKIDHVNVTLHPGGTLTGVLRSPSGKPVNGDCVSLQSPQAQLGLVDPGGEDTTGSNGRYFIPDLPPGVYQLSFGCQFVGPFPDQWFRSEPDQAFANYLAIDPGVTTTVNDIVGRAGTISGRVTNKSGRPLPGICVNVANARDGQFVTPVDRDAMTGGHGRYAVGQLAPGRYLVQFTDCNNGFYGTQWYPRKSSESFATSVIVRAGQDTVGIDDRLTVGGSISGRVTGPGGKPANGTCVAAIDPASQSFEGFTSTGKSGRYTVAGLSSGRYLVSFYSCFQGAPNLASITLPKRVRVVAPRAVTGVNARLAAGGTIAGSVIGDSTEPGRQFQACVVAVPTNPNGSFPLVWTDASGRYVMNALAAGTYRVELEDPFCDNADGMPTLAPQWFSDQPDQPNANLVTVRAGHTTGAISAILRAYGGIEGTVTSARHAGVAGECVTAVPFRASPDPVTGLAPTPDIAISQSTGRYRLLDLLPGRYKIEFSTGCGDAGFATQWWDSATSPKAAHVITVGNATITGINATLRR